MLTFMGLKLKESGPINQYKLLFIVTNRDKL